MGRERFGRGSGRGLVKRPATRGRRAQLTLRGWTMLIWRLLTWPEGPPPTGWGSINTIMREWCWLRDEVRAIGREALGDTYDDAFRLDGGRQPSSTWRYFGLFPVYESSLVARYTFNPADPRFENHMEHLQSVVQARGWKIARVFTGSSPHLLIAHDKGFHIDFGISQPGGRVRANASAPTRILRGFFSLNFPLFMDPESDVYDGKWKP